MFKDCRAGKRQVFTLATLLATVFLILIRFVSRTHAGLAPLRKLSFDLFLAIEQTLNRTLAWPGFPGIESLFNAAQRDMKWDVHLFPTLDERPINRTEQQMLCTPANECVFDLGKVIEIVQRPMSKVPFYVQCLTPKIECRFNSGRRTLDIGFWTARAFVN